MKPYSKESIRTSFIAVKTIQKLDVVNKHVKLWLQKKQQLGCVLHFFGKRCKDV